MSLGITVTRTTAAQQVAAGLSERIMVGHFAPGSRLRESAIAAELGVARNTVREAVRILELGGLVRHEVNRGAVVISPTTESVRALYRARIELEAAAVRTPLAEHELTLLRRALAHLEETARTRGVRATIEADLEFHAAIVRMLGSRRIDEFYAGLTTELRFYLTVLSVEDREYDDPEAIISEHRAILTAIESGDPDRAAGALRAHVDENADRICEILRERAVPSS